MAESGNPEKTCDGAFKKFQVKGPHASKLLETRLAAAQQDWKRLQSAQEGLSRHLEVVRRSLSERRGRLGRLCKRSKSIEPTVRKLVEPNWRAISRQIKTLKMTIFYFRHYKAIWYSATLSLIFGLVWYFWPYLTAFYRTLVREILNIARMLQP